MTITTTTLDENIVEHDKNPGEQLASIREQKGYTVEYVANKLHLRARIIELIENNEFHLLPEPVFVKGYLRAYAKLLGTSPEPYLAIFNAQFVVEKKSDRALLWQQSKRESHKAEHIIRWFTILFALGVIVAVGIWWQKNRDTQQIFPTKTTPVDLSLNQTSTIETKELKLTDISKMHSMLNPKPEMSPMEKIGD
ncbi:helix-turn-helix domain-containing protein [Legionella anisa]|uniref:Helix-turn-helix domain-containing protein n=1 Tax=Legionella anisa TaxID=28082 RepID=A0AAX0WTE7_9GAMM|nr:helix-turn-helix domain-containing protein [Legionella anisa]AWN74236.1 helix-turn-helix domain-containing protein [Legionella anisa]KTC72100.1 DNA-binding protein [Legionella anisa]MBN5934323.1 helix-turn-helix domain-containing protein [Legionella anisa]MCW8425732.1 helix-turn-helix domain-containing protein [Legionella anisa]MCW8448838.1 helix-turn-helix domain-containing protein [Legionella anisa]